jgi:hypothetical protein
MVDVPVPRNKATDDTPAALHCNRDKPSFAATPFNSGRSMVMETGVRLSAGSAVMPEIVSRRGLSDARRERRSAQIRTTVGWSAA